MYTKEDFIIFYYYLLMHYLFILFIQLFLHLYDFLYDSIVVLYVINLYIVKMIRAADFALIKLRKCNKFKKILLKTK